MNEATPPTLADLQTEEARIHHEYKQVDEGYQLLRARRLELLNTRAKLRAAIADQLGPAVLPPPRKRTEIQAKVDRCPRCSTRLGWCSVCGTEYGAAA